MARSHSLFVVLDVGTRRITHWNTTEHPTADWTARQFRMIVAGDEPHRYAIHDRDSIYADGVDRMLAAMGLTVLRTPVQAPQANAFCQRLVGTIRRECLDFLIPLTESHLRHHEPMGDALQPRPATWQLGTRGSRASACWSCRVEWSRTA